MSPMRSPVIELEQLAGHVHFPRFCRRHIGVFLLIEEEVEGWEGADGHEHCNIGKLKQADKEGRNSPR